MLIIQPRILQHCITLKLYHSTSAVSASHGNPKSALFHVPNHFQVAGGLPKPCYETAYEVLADWDASVDESSAREAARSSNHSECDNNDLEDLSHECGEFFDSVEAVDLTDAYQEDDSLYLYLDHGNIADCSGLHTPSPCK